MTKRIIVLFLSALAVLSCGSSKDPVGPDSKPKISTSAASVTIDADGTAAAVSLSANVAWKASVSENWASVSPLSGSGNATLTVGAQPNQGASRQATVTIKNSDGNASAAFTIIQTQAGAVVIEAAPDSFDGNKRSNLTYQLLIYSFADSDGDGVGDFNGIKSKLDYLDALGVTALWLSPAHPTSSYHAYDVNDYGTLNPLYAVGTKTSEKAESDFKDLVDAAHSKGIKIYMDYVLNHSGSGNAWFQSVKADPAGSPYKDYYVLSSNPDADVASGKVDNYAGRTSPGMGSWHPLGDGSIGYTGHLHFKLDWRNSTKYITVTETAEAAQASNPAASKWLWIGKNGHLEGLYETSANVFEITLDVDTDWGFLVRTSSTSWDGGTKYGGRSGASRITFGEPFVLDNSAAADITFGTTTYYFASFDASMPDLNYGKYTDCENSPAFKAIAATADRWIRDFGVDGFRLDAVVWVYQTNVTANQRFLDQWYRHCNATYKAAGHSDDIFMVGEAWDLHGTEKQYYKGLISNFEFDFGINNDALMSRMLNNKNGSSFASKVNGILSDHKAVRSDAITSIFLTNHDQDRWAEAIGKNVAKEKQAAAILLTTPGKPFVYQGEELGYWGTKSGGDEYVRTPIMWDKAGNECARKGVDNRVNSSMLTSSISVESQDADAGSLLNVYRTWGRLRNTYSSLAAGTMTPLSLGGTSVASWYMTSGSEKLLVIHNVADGNTDIVVNDSMEHPVALLGKASRKGTTLSLGANSSVVFKL